MTRFILWVCRKYVAMGIASEVLEMNTDSWPTEDCPVCGGMGEIPDDGTNDGECDYCGGTGEVEIEDCE